MAYQLAVVMYPTTLEFCGLKQTSGLYRLVLLVLAGPLSFICGQVLARWGLDGNVLSVEPCVSPV
jgi:hypothetical protein